MKLLFLVGGGSGESVAVCEMGNNKFERAAFFNLFSVLEGMYLKELAGWRI